MLFFVRNWRKPAISLNKNNFKSFRKMLSNYFLITSSQKTLKKSSKILNYYIVRNEFNLFHQTCSFILSLVFGVSSFWTSPVILFFHRFFVDIFCMLSFPKRRKFLPTQRNKQPQNYFSLFQAHWEELIRSHRFLFFYIVDGGKLR